MPFDEKYFSTHTYANITFAKYSMYWWSNRFNAMLARRYGRKGARLLEVGSGMGHLVGDLEDTFETYGMDINHWAVKRSKSVVQKTQLETASAQEIPFSDNSFNVVIIKHIVEHLPDPQKAIQEIGRVTAPGGTVGNNTDCDDTNTSVFQTVIWILAGVILVMLLSRRRKRKAMR